jgi:hypothetical protein
MWAALQRKYESLFLGDMRSSVWNGNAYIQQAFDALNSALYHRKDASMKLLQRIYVELSKSDIYLNTHNSQQEPTLHAVRL